MRASIKNGAILKCDATELDERRCGQQFVSFSHIPLIREQAKATAGWDRVPAWQVTNGLNGSNMHDVCPLHKAYANANAANRTQVLASARAKKKEERDHEKANELVAKHAAREAALAEKAAEKAARAQRKIDHAKRKAQLAEQRAAKRAKRAKGAT